MVKKKEAPTTPDPDSVVPARLQNKSLPNEKLFCLLAALEHANAFNAGIYKLASTLSKGHFTPAALEFNMREWRQESKKLVQESGEEAAKIAETLPMTSGLGKGHKAKKRGADEGGQQTTPKAKKAKVGKTQQPPASEDAEEVEANSEKARVESEDADDDDDDE